MHENRETSVVPALERGADRPEKAERRNDGMNDMEESDRAIVPENQPNQGSIEEMPTAEVGEGRVRTEENAGQAHTNPTQGGKKGVSQGLAGVRQAVLTLCIRGRSRMR
jgi:hypothetical protein